MQGEREVSDGGQKWLIKYGELAIAGEVLAELLRRQPTARLLRRANRWIKRFPYAEKAPDILGALLRVESSREFMQLARLHLKETESKFFKARVSPIAMSYLMNAVLEHHSKSKLFDIIEGYIERYPHDFMWNLVFPVCTLSKRNRRAEKLTARWIRLNIDNPEVSFEGALILTPCLEVCEAAFECVRKAGRKNKSSHYSLVLLLDAVEPYKALVPSVVKYASGWVKRNPSHEVAGKVLGKVMLLTRTSKDIERGKAWYKVHKSNETSWWVLLALLSYARGTGVRPDSDAVKWAKAMLRDGKPARRNAVLLGELITVQADAESIAWAKETVRKRRLFWILARLLRCAPDAESLEMACKALVKRELGPYEGDILHAILSIDKANPDARRRAFYWLRRHPKDKYARAIEKLLGKRG